MTTSPYRPWAHLTIVGALLILFASCATMQKENRRLTNFLDEQVAPQNSTLRIWLLPVAIPVGLTSIAADAVIIHPSVMIPQCALETYRLIWADPQGSMVRQSFLIIPKVISTPLYFGASWGWSSAFMGNICD